MEKIEYQRLSKAEKFHWWYRSIHALILGYIKDSNPLILDAGCGTGGLTSEMAKRGRVVGIDISSLALSLTGKRSVSYIEGSVNNLPFKQNIFDLVTSISVLYHKRVDDKKALKEIYRIMKKRGRMIMVLPAFKCLFSEHDRAVHTDKRYTLREARRLVEEAGFNYVEGRYIFSFLFPVFLIKRIAEKLHVTKYAVSDLIEFPDIINRFLCKVEWIVMRHFKLPFGSSLMVVVRKNNI